MNQEPSISFSVTSLKTEMLSPAAPARSERVLSSASNDSSASISPVEPLKEIVTEEKIAILSDSMQNVSTFRKVVNLGGNLLLILVFSLLWPLLDIVAYFTLFLNDPELQDTTWGLYIGTALMTRIFQYYSRKRQLDESEFFNYQIAFIANPLLHYCTDFGVLVLAVFYILRKGGVAGLTKEQVLAKFSTSNGNVGVSSLLNFKQISNYSSRAALLPQTTNPSIQIEEEKNAIVQPPIAPSLQISRIQTYLESFKKSADVNKKTRTAVAHNFYDLSNKIAVYTLYVVIVYVFQVIVSDTAEAASSGYEDVTAFLYPVQFFDYFFSQLFFISLDSTSNIFWIVLSLQSVFLVLRNSGILRDIFPKLYGLLANKVAKILPVLTRQEMFGFYNRASSPSFSTLRLSPTTPSDKSFQKNESSSLMLYTGTTSKSLLPFFQKRSRPRNILYQDIIVALQYLIVELIVFLQMPLAYQVFFTFFWNVYLKGGEEDDAERKMLGQLVFYNIRRLDDHWNLSLVKRFGIVGLFRIFAHVLTFVVLKYRVKKMEELETIKRGKPYKIDMLAIMVSKVSRLWILYYVIVAITMAASGYSVRSRLFAANKQIIDDLNGLAGHNEFTYVSFLQVDVFQRLCLQ
ncbi:hypothetical protein HK098_000620 [Nowakowskiella sp. JEL0407]|nr:hypothetical protein HK098_000620 [Nowakowskiella sp. JEL0407]